MKRFCYSVTILLIVFLSTHLRAQHLLQLDYPFRLVSYNIRFDNPNDGDNVWANRKAKVANLLRFHKAEIFGLQEALINQIEDLEKEFPGFEYFGVGRNDGKTGGEFCPVFYNAARFKVLESGTFWLSETPEKPGSTGWFATLPRIATWIKFRDKSSGQEFFVFNTHLDHASESARDNGSKLIMDRITAMNDGLPVILCGDFNTKPGTTPYNNIIDGSNGHLQMFDSKAASKYPPIGPTFTFVGWDFIGVPGRTIDYIFVNGQVEVIQHTVICDNTDGVYPSDHLPVLIELNLKSSTY